MPSMSGTATASSYSDKKEPLSGQGKSNNKIGHNPTSSSARVETVSGIPTSSSDGTEDMRGRGPQGGGGAAGFDPPPRVQKLIAQLKRFLEEHMYAAEHVLEAHAKDPKTKWTIHPLMDELKVIVDTFGSATVKSSVEHRTCNDSASGTSLLSKAAKSFDLIYNEHSGDPGDLSLGCSSESHKVEGGFTWHSRVQCGCTSKLHHMCGCI